MNYAPEINEARQYHKAVTKGYERKKFTLELLYNIAIMSAEKYLVAYLMSVGILPEHHTLDSLYWEIPDKSVFRKSLGDELEHIQHFQNICSIDSYEIIIPTDEDVLKMIDTLNYLDEVIDI